MQMTKKISVLLFILFAAAQFCFAATENNNTSVKKNITSHHGKKIHATHHASNKHTKKKLAHAKRVNRPQIVEEDRKIESSSNFVFSIKQKLVDFVQYSVSTLRYSAYKLGGNRVDEERGIYVVDCSSYVDYTLRSVFPNAYFSLVNSSGADKPNTVHYYDFFTALSDEENRYWNKIDEVDSLQAGDILVFRYKNPHRVGHIMVVMDKPVRDGDTYFLSVADSAPSGHSDDTREPHTSGIGIGTLLLKANPRTGQPSAFAWKEGSHWENNVKFAMARPTDIS
jgi:hypothetical protein